MNLCANNLKTFDLGDNNSINELDIQNNDDLGSLNLGKNTKIRILEATNCKLTSLDLALNTSMERLSLTNNLIHTFNLGKNTTVGNIDMRGNPLKLFIMNKNRSIKQIAFDATIEKLEIDEEGTVGGDMRSLVKFKEVVIKGKKPKLHWDIGFAYMVRSGVNVIYDNGKNQHKVTDDDIDALEDEEDARNANKK